MIKRNINRSWTEARKEAAVRAAASRQCKSCNRKNALRELKGDWLDNYVCGFICRYCKHITDLKSPNVNPQAAPKG